MHYCIQVTVGLLLYVVYCNGSRRGRPLGVCYSANIALKLLLLLYY